MREFGRPDAQTRDAADWCSASFSRRGFGTRFFPTIHNGTIWLGILFLIGFTLCYMTAVSWADYSYVMPAGAFGYAVQTMLAVVILHESVNAQRWIGVVLIVTGVLLVGQTHPEHDG